MLSILGKFSTKLAVFQYDGGPPGVHAKSEVAVHNQWLSIDALSVRSMLAADARLTKRFLRFLNSGFRGLFLVRGGQWASYAWLREPSSAAPHHLPRWVRHLDCYWIFHGHTREEFRRRGYFTRLLEHIVETVQNKDPAARIYVDARIENTASRRAILSAGFSPRGLITTRQVWAPRVGSLVIHGSWQRQEAHPNLPLTSRVLAPALRATRLAFIADIAKMLE